MPTLNQTTKKVREFAELPKGWRYGSGVPASTEKVEQAITALFFAYANGISIVNAFPGSEGEILVSFYHEEHTLDVTLEVDGSFTIAQDESDRQVAFTEGNSKEQAFDAIREFGQRTCDSSELYIEESTIQYAGGSKAPHLVSQATEAFQLLIPHVPSPSVAPRAYISFDSTQNKWAFRLSTGQYRMKQFRRGVGMTSPQAIQGMSAMSRYSGGVKAGRGRLSLV